MKNENMIQESQPAYPIHPHAVPNLHAVSGDYLVRFASSLRDLEKVFRLRFEVYNLEMNEGLEASFLTGCDKDAYDAQCHHLLVEHRGTGDLVGTYRMQTQGMAAGQMRRGFYSDGEFMLDDMPPYLLAEAVEVGRACIARAHRNGRVLQMLWKGLAHYLNHNQKRFLFGCCSLASQNPIAGRALWEDLKRGGFVHPALWVAARPDYRLEEVEMPVERPNVEVPRLLQGYLNLGGVICGEPAIDRAFKTIDYLVLVDVEAMPKGLFQRFLGRTESAVAV